MARRLWLDAGLALEGAMFGLAEIIFVVEDAWSAERFALESYGVRYLVPSNQLPDWLPAALPGLCAFSRLRRLMAEAASHRPVAPPLPPAYERPRRMSLHAAETTFREMTLRLLLARNGSRSKAASEAGVPYRSFCEMLRKLGVD